LLLLALESIGHLLVTLLDNLFSLIVALTSMGFASGGLSSLAAFLGLAFSRFFVSTLGARAGAGA